MKSGRSDPEYVQGVERGFAVIKAFSAETPSLTIAQVEYEQPLLMCGRDMDHATFVDH